MRRNLSRISISLMTLGLAGFIALTALAGTRPFHLREHGTLTLGADGIVTAEGTGTATHLGRMQVHRTFTLKSTTTGPDLEVDGQATLTAANGDQLESSIKGVLNPQTGHAVLVYEWKGGTGRFQNAAGTTVWLVEVHADQTYDVVADGVINY